jgi:hypothetical protein
MKERRDGIENGMQHSRQYGRCTQWRREAERRRRHTGKHTKHTTTLQELESRRAIKEYGGMAAAENNGESKGNGEERGRTRGLSFF